MGRLLDYRYISKIDESEAKGWLNLFTVDKILRMRRRMITEPRDINRQLLDPRSCHLPSHSDCINDVGLFPGAETYDFDASFNSFELLPEIQPFYCFKYERLVTAML